MERTFFRYHQDGSEHQSQKNIAVIGLSSCAGTTLVASSLALFYSENGNSVTFIECGEPLQKRGLLYDAVSMDQRFQGRTFHDAYSILSGDGSLRGIRNQEQGVNWLLITPHDVEWQYDLSHSQRERLASCSRDRITVFDAGEGWLDVLRQEADLMIAVVDPSPSCLLRSEETIRYLHSQEQFGHIPLIWAVNRTTSGISRRDVRRFLGSREILWVPDLSLAELHRDELHSRFHWENSRVRDALVPLFTKVSHLNCE